MAGIVQQHERSRVIHRDIDAPHPPRFRMVGDGGDRAFFGLENFDRDGGAQLASEFVATFGLVGVILGGSRTQPAAVPFAVGAYITAAYWFTASTSFANPAVTVARAATNSFAGIRPMDAPGFVLAQVLGGAAAAVLFRWLLSAPTLAPMSAATRPAEERA